MADQNIQSKRKKKYFFFEWIKAKINWGQSNTDQKNVKENILWTNNTPKSLWDDIIFDPIKHHQYHHGQGRRTPAIKSVVKCYLSSPMSNSWLQCIKITDDGLLLLLHFKTMNYSTQSQQKTFFPRSLEGFWKIKKYK